MRVAACALLGLGAWASASASLRGGSDEAAYYYSYVHHGQDWAHGQCANRQAQSPIDLGEAAERSTTWTLASPKPWPSWFQGAVHYYYQPVTEPLEIQNSGHAIAVSMAGKGYGGITYDNGWYNLVSVTFHAVSEHTFRGEHTPLEIHFVHKKYDSGAMLVVAVPFKSLTAPRSGPPPKDYTEEYDVPKSTDPNFHAGLQYILETKLPGKLKKKLLATPVTTGPLDLNQFLAGSSFWEYKGSLTVPPCSERVIWLVRREAQMASDEQVRVLHDALYRATNDFGNYRSTMPLNKRQIVVKVGVQGEPPAVAPLAIATTPAPFIGEPKPDLQFGAIPLARHALRTAHGARRVAKEVYDRMVKAAQLHYAQHMSAAGPTIPPDSSIPMGLDPTKVHARARHIGQQALAGAHPAANGALGEAATVENHIISGKEDIVVGFSPSHEHEQRAMAIAVAEEAERQVMGEAQRAAVAAEAAAAGIPLPR